jgi:hypothetical protein
MATIKTKPITLFVPFTKIERRAADDALIVEGYCFVNPTVPGDRYSVKRSAMEAATADYLDSADTFARWVSERCERGSGRSDAPRPRS